MTDQHKAMIEAVLADFDFVRVHRTMLALGWKWSRGYSDYYQPTLDDLRESARRQLTERIQTWIDTGEPTFGGTGGFQVAVDCDSVWLDFVVAEGGGLWSEMEENNA